MAQRPRVSPRSSSGPSDVSYWVLSGSGQVIPFGDAGDLTAGTGSNVSTTTGASGSSASVAMAGTPDGKGYWITDSAGDVQAFGDAGFFGPSSSLSLVKPIVGMASTPDGLGYWLVASDGGIFSFGDARFFGSTGSITLAKPVVGMARTPDGLGYWLVASDGGIFAYGDARFFGSTGAIAIVKPVVGMAPSVSGSGYWLVASDGGIFAFGNALFYGSTGAQSIPAPVTALAATGDGEGYWMVGTDGSVYNYGDAYGSGSAVGHIASGSPAVDLVATVPDVTGGSAQAQKAVKYALAQLGVPYLYGGTGQGGFDCSGLVMEAYLSAGVSLPRGAQDQYTYTIPVPPSVPLEPGDVLFFGTSFSAVSHDGIYIGNGEMVDAPHTGAFVRIESYQWDDYLGATRPAP